MTKTYQAFTDGSSRGNPGPAGWAVLHDGELSSGNFEYATNNFAELYAAREAIGLTPPNCHVHIHTDSQLVIGWLSKGWACNIDLNRFLLDDIIEHCNTQKITYSTEWVKGHSTDLDNTRVDAEAYRQSTLVIFAI
jgi:ribonuclease HI